MGSWDDVAGEALFKVHTFGKKGGGEHVNWTRHGSAFKFYHSLTGLDSQPRRALADGLSAAAWCFRLGTWSRTDGGSLCSCYAPHSSLSWPVHLARSGNRNLQMYREFNLQVHCGSVEDGHAWPRWIRDVRCEFGLGDESGPPGGRGPSRRSCGAPFVLAIFLSRCGCKRHPMY